MSRQIAMGAVVGFAVAVMLLAWAESTSASRGAAAPSPVVSPPSAPPSQLRPKWSTGRPTPASGGVRRALEAPVDGGP